MYTDALTVKAYLGNTLAIASDDLLIEGFVEAAASIIDGYCHQSFEAESDTTRYFDPCADVDGRTLYLDAPLCAITSVTNGDGVVIAPSAYVTEPRNSAPWFALKLKSNSGLSWQSDEIAIAGKWAYSVTAPADIQQAAMRLAGYLYRQRDNGFDLDRMLQTQNGVVVPFGLPRDISDILASYRRIVV